VRLVPSGQRGTLAELADNSFGSYEDAAVHAARAPDISLKIAYELGYLDAHFIYPIGSANAVFRIQTLVASDLADTTKLAIRDLPLVAGKRNRRLAALSIEH
jgi:hypothetical protein